MKTIYLVRGWKNDDNKHYENKADALVVAGKRLHRRIVRSEIYRESSDSSKKILGLLDSGKIEEALEEWRLLKDTQILYDFPLYADGEDLEDNEDDEVNELVIRRILGGDYTNKKLEE